MDHVEVIDDKIDKWLVSKHSGTSLQRLDEWNIRQRTEWRLLFRWNMKHNVANMSGLIIWLFIIQYLNIYAK